MHEDTGQLKKTLEELVADEVTIGRLGIHDYSELDEAVEISKEARKKWHPIPPETKVDTIAKLQDQRLASIERRKAIKKLNRNLNKRRKKK